jgi:hypothetical protein
MEVVSELLDVLIITILGICVGFGVFLRNHTKEHKKEMKNGTSN